MNNSDGEFELTFRKSSRSGTTNNACVEVAAAGGQFFVRDSKNPDGGMLRLEMAAARRLIAKVRGWPSGVRAGRVPSPPDLGARFGSHAHPVDASREINSTEAAESSASASVRANARR